jgi:CDP-diacylglycerol--glycerol-3-phosphate 3-phosphatidyltransferase
MRIVLTVSLYPILLMGARELFTVLFLVTAVSDAIDGYLARRWKSTTKFGARIDSIADYLFFGSVPIWIFLALPQSIALSYLIPLLIVAAVSVVYLLVRLNVPATFYHLPSAKLANITVVVVAALLLLGYVEAWPVWIAACLVILAEIEELAVIAGINEPPRRRA